MPDYYDDWRSKQYECHHCDWKGPGADLARGEMFSDLFEVDCPSCGGRITTVTHPTLAESRANWDQLTPGDRTAVLLVESHLDDFEKRCLRRADELPDLAGDDLILAWDIESWNGGDTIIRFGDRVLWREPAFYEGYERFEEVAEILFLKYGTRLQDLVPTRRSELNLYGDRIGSPSRIESFRDRLARRGDAASLVESTNYSEHHAKTIIGFSH